MSGRGEAENRDQRLAKEDACRVYPDVFFPPGFETKREIWIVTVRFRELP